jgi:hypothetical protein
MSQISPPIRVLAVCAIALLAGWMLFLRPKAEPVAAAPEPAAATPVATGAPAATTSADATAGATPAAAAPEADPAVLSKLPAGVARAVRRDKVLVLLFWNRQSADDRAVRRSLRVVDRWDGRVFVDQADVRRISRYAPITRGANVEQSPTIVVVDRNLKAEALVGFVDAPTIDQAVLDALRNSGALLGDPYLRKVDRACRVDPFVPQPTNLGRSQVSRYFARVNRVGARLDRRFMAIRAPKRWRAFKAAAHRDHVALLALAREGERAIHARDGSALASALRRERTIIRRYDARMDEHRVLACGTSA